MDRTGHGAKRQLTTIGLMVASLSLLVLLQILWLRNSYDSAYADLRRETSTLFHSTVTSMWDSAVSSRIHLLPRDSVRRRDLQPQTFVDSSIAIAEIQRDVLRRGNVDSSSVKIILSARDSLPLDVVRPLMHRLHPADTLRIRQSQTFVIELGSDTIDRSVIIARMKKTFRENDIEGGFTISIERRDEFQRGLASHPSRVMIRKRFKTPAESISSSHSFTTPPVSVTPGTEYQLTMRGFRSYVISRIAPEIFFSLVLTALTASAFFVLYRNIQVQQRLVQARNDFISNMTHELKTPVATVSVALEAIRNFTAGDNPILSKEYIDIAQREVKRLNGITDRILEHSLLESEKRSPQEANDLDSVVKEVLSGLQLILKQRQGSVTYLKEGHAFMVAIDRSILYQVVENLIDNAIKYSSEAPRIEVKLLKINSAVELRIRDEGIGIAHEYHQKVFEKFFRVPTGDIHSVKGYGLGLSFVHQVVTSVGGSVSIMSEPNKGTTFQVVLPLNK